MAKKTLRFAALIRVSTDQQKKQGQSLKTQTKQVIQAVEQLGGEITHWYKGQQHATAGHEHQLVNEMLAAARKKRKPFGALMVADPTRWSRENAASEKGLDELRGNGIRFFALMQEFDLHDPMFRFMLAQYTAFGALQAGMQKQKSMLNKIERAKEGNPTVGSLPFGREYDRETGAWRVDEKQRAKIVDAAERYLKGESIADLATECGVDATTLHNVLRNRAGTQWPQTFRADDLNIDATVVTTVPRLLPEKTIKAVGKKMDKNRTHVRGKNIHKYLLAGHVLCDVCGRALSPQLSNGTRYYRPAVACDCPIGHVRADDLEAVVIRQLFETLSNPKAVEAAIAAARPDREKAEKQRKRQEDMDAKLATIKRGRAKLMKALTDDLLPEDEVRTKLAELRGRERKVEDQRDRLAEALANVPSAEEVRALSKRVSVRLSNKRRDIAHDFAALAEDWDASRALVEKAFDGTTLEGRPMGVYIRNIPGYEGKRPRPWGYTLRGHLVEDGGRTDLDPEAFGPDYDYVNGNGSY